MSIKFSLAPGERAVMEEKTMIRSGRISAFAGRLVLTDARLVFEKKPNPFHGFLFGGLAGWIMGKSANLLPLDTPVSDITDVERSTFGRAIVLVVRTSAREYQFLVSKTTIDQWMRMISVSRAGGV